MAEKVALGGGYVCVSTDCNTNKSICGHIRWLKPLRIVSTGDFLRRDVLSIKVLEGFKMEI